MKPQEKRKRPLLRWLITGMLSIVLLLFLFLALIQLPFVKHQISSRVSKLLSSDPNQQIQIGKILGFLPFRIRINEIQVRDAEGTWLQLNNLYVQWSPFSLLRGAIYVNEINAARVDIARAPQKPGEPAPEKSKPFQLPQSLPDITIEELKVTELSLGSELLGHSGTFTLQGSLGQPEAGRGLRTSLHVRRIDEGPPTRADLTAVVNTQTSRLRVDFEFQEAPGGWTAAVAGLKDATPLNLTLHGNGPLDGWNGRLQLDAGQYGSLSTDLMLAATDNMKLALQGSYSPGSLVGSSPIEPLLASGAQIAFAGRYEVAGKAVIDHAAIEGTDFRVQVTGSYAFKEEQLQTGFSLRLSDLSALETLAKTHLEGELVLKGSFAGPVKEPQGQLFLELREVEVEDYRAEQVQSTFRLEPLGPLSLDSSGVKISAEGKARGLEALRGKPLPEDNLSWSLDGKIRAQQEITLSSFEVTGDHLRLSLSGHYRTSDMKGELDAQLNVSNLEPLANFIDQQLPGSASLEAHLQGNGASRSASGTISGFLKPAKGFPAAPAALFGEKLVFGSQFDFKEGSKFEVPTLKFESPVFLFNGKSSVDMSTDSVLASWQLSVPSLAPLEPVAGKPLSGSIQAKGEIEGPLHSFKATATVDGNKVRFDKVDLPKLLLTTAAQDLPKAPKGDLALTLRKKDATVKASAGFSMEGANLTVKPLAFDAPGTELQGEATANLDRALVKGYLKGRIVDLSLLGRFLEQPMGGRGKVDIELSPGKRGQNVAVDLQARGLTVLRTKARILDFSADLQNVLQAPAGKASLNLKGFETADLTIDRLTFEGSGDEQGMNFDGSMQGESTRPFEMQTRGSIKLSSDGQTLRLERLKGRFDKYPVRLLQPLSVQRSQQRFSLDGLALALGTGRIQGSGSLEPSQVKFDADLHQIPLEPAGYFGGPPVSGAAGGRIHLSGPSSAPEATVDIQLKDVRVKNTSLQDLPPIQVNASARLERGLLSLSADLQGLTEKPARAKLEAPVQFSLKPFDFSVPQNGRIDGFVDVEADLAKVARLVPLDGQTVSGKTKANLNVGGQIDSPSLSGLVTLENASYENFQNGTVLKDLNARITGAGRRLTIERFQANDGGKGTVRATGFVEVDPERHFPLDLNINLSNATLVRRAEITGTADGSLSVAGSLTAMKISGNLMVSPVEANLPERLPPEMTQLHVIDIYGDHSEPKAPQQEDVKESPPFQLALDIKVNLPRRIFVRGWGLDSEWRGNLKIAGTAEKPGIVGSLTSVRGKVDFLNRSFDITSGTITFYGESPPAPRLDITAESKVEDMTARITFSGLARDPKMTLSSDPPLPSDEILAKVLFGRSATDITPSQALQLAMVARSLAGGGRGQMDFMSRTRKFLGLDELEFKSSEEGLTKGTLGIGKYLTEGVYLNVQKGVGQGADKARVEVEVTPNITVESEVGSDSTSGIGVNWKFDY